MKGLVQGILSRVPGGMRLNDWLQASLGGLRDFDANVAVKVNDWLGIMHYLSKAGRPRVEGRTLLEVGSGWYPTLPLCFALAGSKRIYTVDLTRHMSERKTLGMIRALGNHLEQIAEAAQLSLTQVREAYDRIAQRTSLPGVFEAARLEYLAPQDASNLSCIQAGTIDIVYSNSVLEHVAPDVIPKLMMETRRLLGPEGLMLHAVACNDHYALFDRSISFVNYLKFPQSEWRFWNNNLNYQNRLRAPDFIRFARETGFTIIHESRAVRAGTREALERMTVAPEFASYSKEDLAATTVDFVAAKSE